MALSRIWSAFIIIAILVASLRMFFFDGGKDVYSRMVVGKQGDTSRTMVHDSAALASNITSTIAKNAVYKNGETKYIKIPDKKYISYREQPSDGIIATCKSSVEICLGLIGIMALFMGFMSIAENAGGIRFLA